MKFVCALSPVKSVLSLFDFSILLSAYAAIQSDFDLDIMRPNKNLTDVTRTVLQGLEAVLQEFKPD